MRLDAGTARLEIRPEDGGRIRSLTIDGVELLVTEGYGPVMWGSYPMAPWAGRIRDGRFLFRGRDIQLERNDPPNALHGTVFQRPWQVDGAASLSIDLGSGWPFAGQLGQTFELQPGSLTVRLRLNAIEAMPAVIGWHPWFRRRLETGRPGLSEPADLVLPARAMYVRDADGITTATTTAPTARPWDDCFTDLTGPPRLTWPGILELEVESSCDHWVVYDQLEHAICVEPQTGPPDFTTIRPAVLEAGETLEATMTWRWRRLG
jgi:aldose 1-epimerase